MNKTDKEKLEKILKKKICSMRIDWYVGSKKKWSENNCHKSLCIGADETIEDILLQLGDFINPEKS